MAKNISSNSNPTMEDLLSSYTSKLKTVIRGQQVEAEVLALTEGEVIMDINTKSDGVLSKRELSNDQKETIKIGDKLKLYVSIPENEVGQTILSFHMPVAPKTNSRWGNNFKTPSLTKFIQSQKQNSTLSGQIVEVNRGGFLVEIESVRGFLPNSQIGLSALNKAAQSGDLQGKEIEVKVIETDEKNNKLVFSQKGLTDEALLKNLKQFKKGDKHKGVVVASFPFALAVKVGEVVGLVFSSDVAWEKEADLSKYQKGQEVEVMVLGLDESLGRLNLSLKHLIEDPFTKLAEKFQADDVVKGEVLMVDENGVTVKLAEGVEGVLPVSKMDQSASYEKGKTITILIDTVDIKKHKIALAPMVTSTEGLIYK